MGPVSTRSRPDGRISDILLARYYAPDYLKEVMAARHPRLRQQPRWEFPKIGDPNMVSYIVGSLFSGPQNKVPLIFGSSQMGLLIDTELMPAGKQAARPMHLNKFVCLSVCI